jgi:integrase
VIQSYFDQETGETRFAVYVNVRSSNGGGRVQKRKNSLKTQAEAHRVETQLTKQCQRELWQRENVGQSWKNVVDRFEGHLLNTKTENLNETTRTDYVASIRKHCKQWESKFVTDISLADAQDLFDELTRKGISIGHQKIIKNVVIRMYEFAIKGRLISPMTICPMTSFKFPKVEDKIPEILNLSQIRKLLLEAKKLKHLWYPVWATALLTGMRNGELYALTWNDVNFEDKLIHVTKSYDTRKKRIKSTKAGYWRYVTISPELEELLKYERKTDPEREWVLPRLQRWHQGDQARVLRHFCIGLGLPSVRFHTLRACFATQLMKQGVPPIQVMKIGGWKDLDTMNRYIRLAGIEITGATDGLKVLPEQEVFAKAVDFMVT